MNAYPAMRATQGPWEYFVVKMRIKELAKEIMLTYEAYEDEELDEIIHYKLSQERLVLETIDHFAQPEDRILNTLVVVSTGGDPKFSSVVIEESSEFDLIGREEFNDTFGILSFNGKQKNYAIDGQEILLAIRMLLNQRNREFSGSSDKLESEEISVIMYIFGDQDENFLERFKKLHSNTNRLATFAQIADEFLRSSE